MEKKIIDGFDLVKNTESGKQYIQINPMSGEKINDIEVEMVKIIGKLNGTEEQIELVMDKKVFFEWVDKLKGKKNG